MSLPPVGEVIAHHFDLEILLKHRELRLIEDEIAKVNAMMVHLAKAVSAINNNNNTDRSRTCSCCGESFFTRKLVEHYIDRLPGNVVSQNYSLLQQQPERIGVSTRRSSQMSAASARQLQQQRQSISPPPPPSSINNDTSTDDNNNNNNNDGQIADASLNSLNRLPETTEMSSSSSSPSATDPTQSCQPSRRCCLTRRRDGTLVKLVCPDCNRESFGSVQGFINHTRLSHGSDLSSHDMAAKKCGVIVADQQNYNNNNRMYPPQPAQPSISPGLVISPSLSRTSSSTSKQVTCQQPQQQRPVDNLVSFVKQQQPSSSKKKGKLNMDKIVSETLRPTTRAHLFEDEMEIDPPPKDADKKKSTSGPVTNSRPDRYGSGSGSSLLTRRIASSSTNNNNNDTDTGNNINELSWKELQRQVEAQQRRKASNSSSKDPRESNNGQPQSLIKAQRLGIGSNKPDMQVYT